MWAEMIKGVRDLNEDEIREVQLYVIKKNSIALNMYLKRGFVIDNILSHWIEIKK